MGHDGENRNGDDVFAVWLTEYKEVSTHVSSSLSVMARLLAGYYAFNGFLFVAFGSVAVLPLLQVGITIETWDVSFYARNWGLALVALVGILFSWWAAIMVGRFKVYSEKAVARAGDLEIKMYGHARAPDTNSIFSSVITFWNTDKRRWDGFLVGKLVIGSVGVVWGIMGLGAFFI